MFASNKAIGSGAPALPGDDFFKNVTLLLQGNGTNGGQNNTFVDSSTNNFSITRSGNPTQGSFTPFSRPNGYWSNHFDGSGDFLTIPDNAAFDMGTGDFTLETWIYITHIPGSTGQAIFGDVNGYEWYMYPYGAGGLNIGLQSFAGGYTQIYTTNNPVPANTWTHIAVTKSSGTLRFFVNGQLCTTTGSLTSSLNITSTINIGRSNYNNGNFLFGYLSNFRVVKGTAVYTSAFTPPVAPLTAISGTSLLMCQSNTFKDNSTNNFTITSNGNVSVQPIGLFNVGTAYAPATRGGSMFLGGDDSISVTSSTALNVGTGDFTVEGWLYMTSAPGGYVTPFLYVQNGQSFAIRYGDGGFGTKLQFSLYADSLGSLYSTAVTQSTSVGRWMHIAFTRQSGTCRCFVDGQQQNLGTGVNPSTYPLTQFTDNTSLGNASTCSLGSSLPGYLSGWRVVNSCLYTSSFTPPSSAPTAVSGTTLLLNFTNASIFDAAAIHDIETVGNAQISTSVAKYGTGSMYFDGSGDYLPIFTSPNFAFGTGDFTIEFWANSNNVSGSNQLGFFQMSTSTGGFNTSYTTGIHITQGVSGSAAGTLNGGIALNVLGTWIGSTSPVIATGSWYHIAVTRQSGSVRLFVNGVQAGSTVSVTGAVDAQNLVVGGYYNTNYLYHGYLDDFRITRGVARYTGNFTPPTELRNY